MFVNTGGRVDYPGYLRSPFDCSCSLIGVSALSAYSVSRCV